MHCYQINIIDDVCMASLTITNLVLSAFFGIALARGIQNVNTASVQQRENIELFRRSQ